MASKTTSKKWIKGDVHGIEFPTKPEEFEAQAVEFLTLALRTSGALQEGNDIIEVVNVKEIVAGGMGRKLVFDVVYSQPNESLHKTLFAKFEIDEESPIHHLYAGVMNSEVHFALLSRAEDFPVNVPKCYFADVNEAENKGILITECIPFGKNGIETEKEKAKDFLLSDAHEYYLSIASSLGRLAAYDYSGGIDQTMTERLVPKVGPPEIAALSHDSLVAKAKKLVEFIDKIPQIFTPDVWDSASGDEFVYWLPRAVHSYDILQKYLREQAPLNVVSHWNANLDNAWFWKDDSGDLVAGLLDWGNVGRVNLAVVILNMITCTETEILEQHGHSIIERLLSVYEQEAGIEIDRAQFSDSLDIAMVAGGLDLVLELPDQLTSVLPNYDTLSGKMDPRMLEDFLGRALTRVLLIYLSLWKQRDVPGTLRRVFGDL